MPEYRKRTGLTAAFCRNITKPGRYHDRDGLMLIVEVSKKKGWLHKRWTQRLTIQGVRRDLGLGGYRDVSLQEARDKAQVNRRIARSDGDPRSANANAVKRSSKPTFSEANESVIVIQKAGWRGANTEDDWRRSVENYAAPIIGKKPVDEITTADVMRIIEPIWPTKNETAKRLLQRLSTVFKWAVVEGFRPDDPTAAITSVMPKINGTKDRRHPALPYGEISDLLKTLRDKRGPADVAVMCLTLVILTAGRSGEVRGARFDEFDLRKKVWRIPGHRMKNGREHHVPLSVEALEIVEHARTLHPDSELLFPSPQKRGAEITAQHLAPCAGVS